LEHIDIGDQLREGSWLAVLYHHNCPDCQTAIPKYERMARDSQGKEHPFRIALVEMPPYDRTATRETPFCSYGRLDESKKWFTTTPVTVLMVRGAVKSVWVVTVPDWRLLSPYSS
jgi:hypothetical protein